MRYWFTFILLLNLNFAIAHAITNKDSAVIIKSALKGNLSLNKEAHSLNQQLFEQVDRIHQHIHHHVLSLATYAECHTWFKIAEQPLKIFKRKVNFKEQFLFTCLYPKHTFW